MKMCGVTPGRAGFSKENCHRLQWKEDFSIDPLIYLGVVLQYISFFKERTNLISGLFTETVDAFREFFQKCIEPFC